MQLFELRHLLREFVPAFDHARSTRIDTDGTAVLGRKVPLRLPLRLNHKREIAQRGTVRRWALDRMTTGGVSDIRLSVSNETTPAPSIRVSCGSRPGLSRCWLVLASKAPRVEPCALAACRR